MTEKLSFQAVSFARPRINERANSNQERAIIVNVSFSVRQGEIFVIAGPSGSGKSTLLRLANRLLLPNAGTIRLDGLDISEIEPTMVRRRIGLVQQVAALFEGTVLENVCFGPRLFPDWEKTRDETNEADLAVRSLTLAGLSEEFLDRDAESLSEGEKQRVAIARVLANEPEVLLLDEPTASLDPTSTLRVEKHIKHIRESAKLAILLVTHDVEQAKRVGDRGILLVEGRKVDEGPLPDFFANPGCETTRAFVNGML